jgi:uncharacterized protein DUF6881
MSRYLTIVWHHDHADEPSVLLSEIVDGREARKVETFADGRTQSAGGCRVTLGCLRPLMPRPEEIGQDPQFSVAPITADAFEREWRLAADGQSSDALP